MKIIIWLWVWGCAVFFLPRILLLKFRHHMHTQFLVSMYRGEVNFESLAERNVYIEDCKSRLAKVERSQLEIASSIEKAWRSFGVGD